MTDSPPTAAPSPPPAPRTLILGYFGGISGPTRVRRIAAVGLLILAVLDTGLAATLALISGRPVLERLDDLLHPLVLYPPASGLPSHVRAAPTWLDWIQAVGEVCLEFLVPLLLLLCCALGALLLIVATVGVYHGRRWACRIAFAPAVVHLLLFILISAVLLTVGVYFLTPTERTWQPLWWYLLMFGLGILSGLVALLLIDLCAFLRWIARAPAANPPPRKFL